MDEQEVEKIKQQLKDALDENASLVEERANLLDRVDSLESASDVSEKELQHLRGIAAGTRHLNSFLLNRDYQAAVVNICRLVNNAQEENLL